MGSSGSTLWVIGTNTHGQLGTNESSIKKSPQRKTSGTGTSGSEIILQATEPRRLDVRSTAARVSCGETHTAALLSNGSILTWGSNDSGQLGHEVVDAVADIMHYNHESVTGLPQLVHFPSSLHQSSRSSTPIVFIRVSCGSEHTAAIAEDGTLFTWGSNQNGRLGRSCSSQLEERTPKRVQMSCELVSVSCGACHTAACAVSNGRCFTWGLGTSGRLGHNNEKDQHFPVVVDRLSGGKNKLNTHQCVAGGHHTLVLASTAAAASASSQESALPTVYSFGGGSFGKLGHGSTASSLVPMEVLALSPKRLSGDDSSYRSSSRRGGETLSSTTSYLDWVTWISAGAQHSCAVTRRGVLYTWGQGNQGRLGHGGNDDVHVPRPVRSLCGRRRRGEGGGGGGSGGQGNGDQHYSVLFSDCGAQQTCVLCETGELFVFGLSRLVGAVVGDNSGRSGKNLKSLKSGSGGGQGGHGGHGGGKEESIDSHGGGGILAGLSVLEPTKMKFFENKSLHVGHVACGGTHTVFVTRPIAERPAALSVLRSVQRMFDHRAVVIQ